ncbi:hypothetical protein, partial [Bacillus cereus]|uniref:hypothetical protein n=1 Tax=Bacillus cereus TaxID=1396 RepID=UPI00311FA500
CDTVSASSQVSVSKYKSIRLTEPFLYANTVAKNIREEKIFFNAYSGHSTGNSPPKYILFKRLKLSLV